MNDRVALDSWPLPEEAQLNQTRTTGQQGPLEDLRQDTEDISALVVQYDISASCLSTAFGDIITEPFDVPPLEDWRCNCDMGTIFGRGSANLSLPSDLPPLGDRGLCIPNIETGGTGRDEKCQPNITNEDAVQSSCNTPPYEVLLRDWTASQLFPGNADQVETGTENGSLKGKPNAYSNEEKIITWHETETDQRGPFVHHPSRPMQQTFVAPNVTPLMSLDFISLKNVYVKVQRRTVSTSEQRIMDGHVLVVARATVSIHSLGVFVKRRREHGKPESDAIGEERFIIIFAAQWVSERSSSSCFLQEKSRFHCVRLQLDHNASRACDHDALRPLTS